MDFATPCLQTRILRIRKNAPNKADAYEGKHRTSVGIKLFEKVICKSCKVEEVHPFEQDNVDGFKETLVLKPQCRIHRVSLNELIVILYCWC